MFYVSVRLQINGNKIKYVEICHDDSETVECDALLDCIRMGTVRSRSSCLSRWRPLAARKQQYNDGNSCVEASRVTAVQPALWGAGDDNSPPQILIFLIPSISGPTFTVHTSFYPLTFGTIEYGGLSSSYLA